MSDNYGKLAPWRLRLSGFESDIVLFAGIKQQTAYTLSRLPINKLSKKVDEKVSVLKINQDTFKVVYDVDVEQQQRESDDYSSRQW